MIACTPEHRAKVFFSCEHLAIPVLSRLLDRRSSVHATQEQMRAALTAEVREHHRFLLRELLSLIDALDRSIKHLELEIEEHLPSF